MLSFVRWYHHTHNHSFLYTKPQLTADIQSSGYLVLVYWRRRLEITPAFDLLVVVRPGHCLVYFVPKHSVSKVKGQPQQRQHALPYIRIKQ